MGHVVTHISPVLRQEVGRRIRLGPAGRRADDRRGGGAPRVDLECVEHLENGITRVTVHLVRSMMDVYDQRLDDVLDMIREARQPGWWKQYGISDHVFVALETGTTRISNYELIFIPGILQTADYAQALFTSSRNARSDDWIANRLAVRFTRQERLTDEEHPLHLDAIVHECALRQPVGHPGIMRNQLQHLALIKRAASVALRVLPATTISSEAMIGSFSMLDFPRPANQASATHSTPSARNVRTSPSMLSLLG
jgi:hypothetical protein